MELDDGAGRWSWTMELDDGRLTMDDGSLGSSAGRLKRIKLRKSPRKYTEIILSGSPFHCPNIRLF